MFAPYVPAQKEVIVHEKWMKWTEAMNKHHLKYDVKYYQLKNMYEKTLDNPRTCIDQEGMLNDVLGTLDITLTYLYEYDGGVIGAGGHFQLIEDTMNLGNDDDSKEVCQQKETALYNRIRSIIDEKGGVRVGIYTRCGSNHPSFELISTYEEDMNYYVQKTLHLYDDTSPQIYYGVRYGISSKTYYVLSGMTAWTDDIFNEIVAPPCPDQPDNIDECRYYEEYMAGVDLTPIYQEIDAFPVITWKDERIISNKYGLTHHLFSLLRDKTKRLSRV